jgi:hypothetical protein
MSKKKFKTLKGGGVTVVREGSHYDELQKKTEKRLKKKYPDFETTEGGKARFIGEVVKGQAKKDKAKFKIGSTTWSK